MVSVIVPTITGGLSYLVDLIPTLEMQTEPHELIIIDNSSRDGTTNYLGNHACTVKINTSRLNFSQSNNQGAKIAGGDYILFLNNDTKVEPNLLQEMLSVFNLDEKIAVVGCQLRLARTPHKVHHAGVMFTDKYEPYELGLDQPFGVPELPRNDERVVGVREVPAVTAACLMIKKGVFFEVGGFDENYINGWEDIDLNLKVRGKGYKIYYTGRTYAYHHHFGTKDRGRFMYEKENRARYESLWMTTGKAKEVLNGIRES